MSNNEGYEILEVEVKQLVEAYESREGPFSEDLMPETTPAESLSNSDDRALFLTFGSALNYQRSSERLWKSMRELWDEENWMFTPDRVVDHTTEDVKEVLTDYGARFPNNDADGWYRIAETLSTEFDGRPENLLEEAGFDAIEVVALVRGHAGLPYLGGNKIAPMWARFMHENVHELSNVTALDIPVDVQVRKVTRAVVEPVVETEFENDNQIRDFWLNFCSDSDVDPTRVDKPFWIIGAYWDEWGREYLEQHFTDIA